jgi:hypothetical protein
LATYLIIPSTPSFTAQPPPDDPGNRRKSCGKRGARRESQKSSENENGGGRLVVTVYYRAGSRRRGRAATTTQRRRRRRSGCACPRPPAADHHGLAASTQRGVLRFAAASENEQMRKISIWEPPRLELPLSLSCGDGGRRTDKLLCSVLLTAATTPRPWSMVLPKN